MDDKTLKSLIKGDENETADFKSNFYDITNKDSRISFVKDVLAMANSCITRDAFIICGVAKNAAGEISVDGIDQNTFIDDAPWHDILSKYSSHPVGFQVKKFKSNLFGKWLVTIQVYTNQRRPVICTKKEGDKLQQGAIYFRNGSKNDVTTNLVTLEQIIARSATKHTQIETDPTYNRYVKFPPPPYYTFIGRDIEIKEIYKRLIDHHKNYILSLTGDGGVGKTSVAYSVATDMLTGKSKSSETFDDVIWISGKDQRIYLDERFEIKREFNSIEDLYNKILLVFHNPSYIQELTMSKKEELVKQCLDGTKFFFVLDNLEVFSQDELHEISQFMSDAPSGHKFLITSRHDLRVHDLYEIQGMDIETFTQYSADVTDRFEIIGNALNEINENISALQALTNGNPLYLKYFLAQVKKGRNVHDIIQRKNTEGEHNLKKYCFDTTIEQLTEKELISMYAVASTNTALTSLYELVYMTRLHHTELNDTMDNLSSVSLVYSRYFSGNKVFHINQFLKNYLIEEQRIPPGEYAKLIGRSRKYSSMIFMPEQLARLNFFLGEDLSPHKSASFNLTFDTMKNWKKMDMAVIRDNLHEASLIYPGNYLVPFINYFSTILSEEKLGYNFYNNMNRDFNNLSPIIANAPDLVGMYIWKSILHLCMGKYEDINIDLSNENVTTNDVYELAEPLIECLRATSYHLMAYDAFVRGHVGDHDKLRDKANELFKDSIDTFMIQPYFFFLKKEIFRNYQLHIKHHTKENVPQRSLDPIYLDYSLFWGINLRYIRDKAYA